MGGISVIIPVFNVAEYLPDCLDSLVGAGLPRGVEIILVNDGSTDGSAAICRDFADAHGAVFVRQKNAGAAAARNAGIQLARGDYLLFVDGDDLVYNGAIGRLAAILENAAPVDINFLNADIINANGHVKKWSYRYNNDKLGENASLAYICATSRFPISPCIKLLRRDFVMENDIFFTERILCEDVDHTIAALLAAKTFAAIDIPYYIARKNRPGSVMTDPKNAYRRFKSVLHIIGKWRENPAAAPMLAVQYLYLLGMYGKLSKNQQAQHRADMRRLRGIMKGGRPRIFLPLRIFTGLFGIKLSSIIFSKLF